MTGINPDEMGDVWPVVQPGIPGDYGTATLTGPTTCEVRSLQTFVITYTVGKFGLDDTGAIRIACRFVQDGGPWQIDNPSGPNFVTAISSNGVPLVLHPEPYAYRPWYVSLRVTVSGGFLREGDTITVTIGDRRDGSPGFLVQTMAEAAMEFRVSVDACATGQFAPVQDNLSVPVIAGPARRWRLVLPTLRRVGESFALGIRGEDEWGNPTCPGAGSWQLTADGAIEGLPDLLKFSDGDKARSLQGLSVSGTGVYRVMVLDESGQELARSNPLVVKDQGDVAYWGDLHGQSGETVGIGSIQDYLEFARDLAFLDVSGHQANDFQVTNAFWHRINATTRAMNSNGRFIVFPGYEWSGNTPVGGDHNVYFANEGSPLVRSSHAMLNDRNDVHTDANTLDALFAALRAEDCVIHSHIGGRPADVSYAHDPKLKTSVELHSNWGTFEWILTDSFAQGHRVGVVCNSDGHKGRPGAGPPGATEFGAYGGLTCFLAPDLSREAIFESMRRRHTYGTTGCRMHLEVRAHFDRSARLFPRDPRYFDVTPQAVDTAIMGDIVETSEAMVELEVTIAAASPIERVDILNGAECVQSLRCYRSVDLGHRLRIYWQGAEYRGRGRNTRWQGEIAIKGAGISALAPVNNWNLERLPSLTNAGTVQFDAVTSGNFAGVDLRLTDVERPIVEISANLVGGQVDFMQLGMEDAVLDAGGLDRQIRLRRLPANLDCTEFHRKLPVSLIPGQDNPVWVRITTLDGHQVWSSPIYLVPMNMRSGISD